jgi:hypothetical protein
MLDIEFRRAAFFAQETCMPISMFRPTVLLILLVSAFPVTAADALFRSSFESSICDNAVAETEPNDAAALANIIVLNPAPSAALVCGAINPVADTDFFRVAIVSSSSILIETIKADGAACDPDMPMSLSLLDTSATVIATDNNGGQGGCASLDGVTSPLLQNLAPGNYYIRVIQSDNSSVIPVYALRIRLF